MTDIGHSHRRSNVQYGRPPLRRDDRGQIFPLILVAIVAATALTLMLLQLGSAHALERRAETAADAAALGAAARWGDGLSIAPGQIGPGGSSTAQATADTLATENNTILVDYSPGPPSLNWQVTVTVETEGGVIGGPIADVVGRQVESTSTAQVVVTVDPLPASPGGSSDEDLADRAGVDHPLEDGSALIRYAGQTCTGGVNTDDLSDAVKVAVLQVEAEIEEGLQLQSGQLSRSCLTGAEFNTPDIAPALRGDQIVLASGQSDAGALLRAQGFCGEGDTFVVSSSPACSPGGLEDFVSVTTRLVPDP